MASQPTAGAKSSTGAGKAAATKSTTGGAAKKASTPAATTAAKGTAAPASSTAAKGTAAAPKKAAASSATAKQTNPKTTKPATTAAPASSTAAKGTAAPASSTAAKGTAAPSASASVPSNTTQGTSTNAAAKSTGAAKGKGQTKAQVGGPKAQQKQGAQKKQGASKNAAQAGAPVTTTPVAAPAAAVANSFLVPTRVVIILRGRYAGRKAVIIKNYADQKSKNRKYSHLLVAGIDNYPLKVTKDMGKRRIAKRSKVRPFLKVINHQHVMPTRYGLDVPLTSIAKAAVLDDVSVKHSKEIEVKKAFQERYNSGKNRWFFTKLRF